MSITGLSEPDKIYKKTLHLRNDSGELDVFEAARYFSGATEASGYNGATLAQRIMREEKQGWRASLDLLPNRGNSVPSLTPHHGAERKIKEKKHKQPSSPGGRLASFLNSLFNQTSSKQRKSKSSGQSMKEEEKSPGGRRKRRSSISHFQSSSTNKSDSKSIYSTSSSGFRTPPIYSYTPTKSYKDFRSYSDHKPVVTLCNYSNGHVKSSALQNEASDEKRNTDYAWLDEKFKFEIGFSEKKRDMGNGFCEKDRIWADKFPSEEKEFRKFNEVDDGGDSDSSSDLFELQNCDLGYYSSDLPVYETTHMDSIKRGAPISNAQK